VASPFFSEASSAIVVLRAMLALACLGLAGCATVRPEDKEFLADPSMIFGSDGEIAAHDEHVLSNREGSFGGGSVSGGGCGCN
jgi:hypothetical protein